MRRSFAAAALALFACTSAPACSPVAAPEEVTAAQAAAVVAPLDSFYVVLDGPAAVSAIPRGVDPRSREAAARTRARIAAIELEQAALLPALARHGGQVVARLSRLANVIQILADEGAARRIEGVPGVLRVERVPLAVPALGSPVRVVGAPGAWAAMPMLQGDGITIGIIDSGIDYTHADFGGEGTSAAYLANDPNIVEPGSFPTAKVVGGWDFVGNAYNPGAGVTNPKPDADPLDCTTPGGDFISGGHGTHVAGIAAGKGVLQDGSSFDGPYEASFDISAFRVGPGVAPRAKLYSLKVFGCEGSTTMLGAALDRASDPDQDGSFADRLDVVNASLGTGYGLGSATVGKIATELTGLGTLIVAAAGNDGQSFFATGSPATYPEVLSVAATVDNDLLRLSVTAPAAAVADYPAAEAMFTQQLVAAGALGAQLVLASPALGCTPFTNAAAVAGKIVLVDRGTCPFVDKLTNAAAAGAIAAVVVDNEDMALPFPMGGADPGSVPIPGVMVRLSDGAALKAALSQGAVAIGVDAAKRYEGPGAELLAGLSSRGPSPIDGRFKPEIAAPGVGIDSAGVGTGIDPANKSGTSMASPVVAGGAALVRQARPDFSPAEVKAALVNAAAPLADFSSVPYGTSTMGSGRMDVARAARAWVTAAADPAAGEIGVSFGSVVADEPVMVKRTFVVTNHGESAVSLGATVEPTYQLPGVVVTVAPASVDLAAGATATVELTLALDPAALGAPGTDPGTPATQGMQNPAPRHYLNEASGVVRLAQVGGGADDLGLPYTGSVRAAVRRHAVAPTACSQAGKSADDPVELVLEGGGAHPEPVVTAFQLAALDEVNSKSDTDGVVASTDLRAIGVATDLATAASFEEAHVFFGVAVTGPWTTPARGPVSLVSITINNDQKGSPEFELRVEARNPDGPFRDALVASTYDIASGERINRLPINILTPDLAKTHPFNNSVLVLSALLSEIGIDPVNPVFAWTASTESPNLVLSSEKANGTFDAARPAVDTARYGLDGAPLFLGSGPIAVHVSPEARAAGTPLDVLLLHHTNVVGERWEVVSLITKSPGNLGLAGEVPVEVAAADTAEVVLVVTNGGDEPAPNVRVEGSLVGGELVSAEAGPGSCETGAALDCALGELAPGDSVTVTATVRGAAGSKSIAVEASVSSDLECESTTLDNEAGGVIGVIAEITTPDPGEEVFASGGCGCRVAVGANDGDGGGAGRVGGIAAALGLLLARLSSRRRNKRAGRG